MRTAVMFLTAALALSVCAQDGILVQAPVSGSTFYNWSESNKAWYRNVPAENGGICYLQISSSADRYVRPDVSGLTLGGFEQLPPSSSIAHIGHGLGISLVGSAYIRSLYGICFYETAFTGTSSDTVALDGVFGYGGSALSLKDSSFSGFGSVSVRGTTLDVSGDGATALTDGKVRLEGAEMTVQPLAATAALTQTMAGDADATVTAAPGYSHLKVACSTASAYTLATGTLTNEPGGVLAVSASGGLAALGATETIKPSKVGAATEGLMPGWLIGSETATPLAFLKLDASKGLVPAETTDGLAGGASVFAKVSSATTAPSGTTSVKGLLLDGASTLTLSADATLSVGAAGETSAILLNYASQNTMSVYKPFAGTGSLSFGGDGVIWGRGAQVGTIDANAPNGRAAELTVNIHGAGDMTFTGADNAYLPRFVLSGANDWTGDTHVSRAMLDAYGLASSLPSGTTLYIHGNARNGGAQLFNGYGRTATLAYDLHLSGWGLSGGSYGGAAYGGRVGAICSEGQGLTLNGSVTLDDSTCLHLYRSTMTFNGAIAGTGDLLLMGTPDVHSSLQLRYNLNAANDYTGATTINGCSVTLGENGTFGRGPVTVKNVVDTKHSVTGDLTINAPSAGKTLSNDIAGGDATLVLTGNPVALTGKISFSNVRSDVSTVLSVKDLTTGSVKDILPASGYGTVKAADGASVVTVDAAADESTKIVLADGEGRLSLVKTGSGTLTLENAQKYTGTTTVKAGTLKIGGSAAFAKLPLREHVSVWLDASQADLCLQDGEGRVTNWVSGVSSANVFGPAGTIQGSWPTASFGCPKRIQSSSWGTTPKYVLNFTSEGNSDRLLSNKAALYKHVFLVVRPTQCGADTYTTQSGAYLGEPPHEGASQFLRNNGGPSLCSSYPFEVVGKASTDPFVGTPFIASINTSSTTAPFTCAIGGTRNNNGADWARRPAPGEYAEMIAYNRALTADEIAEVEQYLKNKWLDQGAAPEPEALALASSSQLVLARGATFDLNGQNQTVAALSGEGEIVNTSGTPVTLTVTSASTFKGRVGAGVTLILAAGGATELVVADGGKVVSGAATSMNVYNVSTAPTDGLLYWLDASATDTLLQDDDGFVTNWQSRVTGLASFVQYGDKEIFPAPKYEAAAFNGKPAVLFGESPGTSGTNHLGRLSSGRACKPETVFLVFKPKGASLNKQSGNIWSPLRDDGYSTCDGIKLDGKAQTSLTPFSNSYFVKGDSIRVDGVDKFALGEKALPTSVTYEDSHLYVVSARRTGEHTAFTAQNNALGMLRADLAGYKAGDYRTYHGHIAEVIAYDRLLSDAETAAVEAYLMAKWGDATPFPTPNVSVFEGATDLVIETTNGQLDAVTLGGSVNLSNVSVFFSDLKSLRKRTQPYLTVTGTATGSPVLPPLGSWTSSVKDGTWALDPLGLILFLR